MAPFSTYATFLCDGKLAARLTVKSADIVLYHKPGLPLAVIEAKANKHEIGKGMQQGLDYARLLDVPFVFASNGDGFIFHDKTNPVQLESEIKLEDFPTPEQLWDKYCVWKGFTAEQLPVISQDYYDDNSGKSPRYYQLQAINKTIEAVSAGQKRVLLVMATGTGKTYTAFQIIWRLWKAKNKKRILFLADRNILVDQTKTNDFQPFGSAMTKITGRTTMLINNYQYKSRRSLFKNMKYCLIRCANNILEIKPTRHKKLELWLWDGHKNDVVRLPIASDPKEIGAALMQAFEYCN